jgi:hypothetical protein
MMKPKGASKDRSEFCGSGFSHHIKYIHLTLEGDSFLGLSKPGMGPNMESNLINLNLPLTTLVDIIVSGKILTCTQ